VKLKIYIPTLGRVNRQITFEQMPPKVREITTLVVHDDEFHQHRELGRNVLSCPIQGDGIGPVRDWILARAAMRGEKYIMMLDDDLTVQRRAKGGRILNATEAEYLEALEWVEETLASGITACGLGVRFLAWAEKVKEYAEPARMMQSLAYNVKMVKMSGARFMHGFEDMPKALMTDFNMTLQLLRNGLTNRVSLLHRITPRAPNAPGGCATWRTEALQSKSAMRLANLHPEVVSIREKKGWTGMGPKMWDVNVQWKKALRGTNGNSRS
jgi:hypothetical protein